MGECFELMRLVELHEALIVISALAGFVGALCAISWVACVASMCKTCKDGLLWVSAGLLLLAAVMYLGASPNAYRGGLNIVCVGSV